MKVLALETSTARGSIAVVDDDYVLVTVDFANDRRNSGPFFQLLADAREQWRNVELIVVGLGPGSYAGVRIAISAATGLQLATDARLIGLPSICATETTADSYHVIGDARRGSLWMATVAAGKCSESPTLVSSDELRDKLSGSSLPVYTAESLRGYPNAAPAFPSAVRLARIAQRPHCDEMLPPLQPLYLREPHITASHQPTWNLTR